MLDARSPTTRDGIRDRAMLHLAVCAGLRVSELTGHRTGDVTLPSMSIRVLGKGRRERVLPLWKATASALRRNHFDPGVDRGATRCSSAIEVNH